METVAVVLEKPGNLGLRTYRSGSGQRGRRRRADGMVGHQFRHRAPALVGPHAQLPWHGLSPRSRLRNGRPGDQRRCIARLRPGDEVFVPGANCYGEIKGLFGGAASRIVVPEPGPWPFRPDWARPASSSLWPPRPITPSPEGTQAFRNSSSATEYWAASLRASPSHWVPKRRPSGSATPCGRTAMAMPSSIQPTMRDGTTVRSATQAAMRHLSTR